MKEGEGCVMTPEDVQMLTKRFIVAGCAGFLGSHMCQALLDMGHIVWGLDNFSIGHKMILNNPSFTFTRADVSSFVWTSHSFRPDFVLHFASPTSPKDFKAAPYQTLLANSEGTKRLMNVAQYYRAKFLLTSTGHISTVADPTAVSSVYYEAKRFSEALVAAYRQNGLPGAKIVRMFNSYGPGMRVDDGRVIPTFIVKALRGEELEIWNGGQWASFTYVDDMIDGIMRLLFSDEVGPVEIGNPNPIRIDQLAQTIVRLANSSSTVKISAMQVHDERPPDLRKAYALGWNPKVNIEEGLKRTIEYFKKQVMYMEAE